MLARTLPPPLELRPLARPEPVQAPGVAPAVRPDAGMIEAGCHPGRGAVRHVLMGRIPFLAALVSAVVLVGAAHAQVYKWVDDKGVVNYSSSPPSKGKGVVKLDEDTSRVTTIPAPEARRDDPAATADPALRRRVDQLEREAAAQRQSAAQQDAAAAEAYRRWVERCRADRRVDCDDPSRGAYVDPRYDYAYPPGYARAQPLPAAPAPGTYRPTPDLVQGGGGVVGPYYRPPPGGVGRRRSPGRPTRGPRWTCTGNWCGRGPSGRRTHCRTLADSWTVRGQLASLG